MPLAVQNRFTVYDVMDAKGVFRENTANVASAEYAKRAFPKMLYHPEGREKITRAAETIATPYGPKEVGEQRELESRTVRTAEEERELLTAGWHTHPAFAMKAAGKPMPPMSSQQRIEDLEAAQADIVAQLETAKRLLEEAGIELPEPAPRAAGVDPLIA